MKFFLLSLLSTSLLFTVACKQLASKDQQLISKVESEIQNWQAELTKYEAVATTLQNFQQEVNTAIPSVPSAPADSLKIRTNSMNTKAKAAITTYKQGITSLTTRLGEYKAGTATKEALELESQTVQASLINMSQAFSRLQSEQVQNQEELSARKK